MDKDVMHTIGRSLALEMRKDAGVFDRAVKFFKGAPAKVTKLAPAVKPVASAPARGFAPSRSYMPNDLDDVKFRRTGVSLPRTIAGTRPVTRPTPQGAPSVNTQSLPVDQGTAQLKMPAVPNSAGARPVPQGRAPIPSIEEMGQIRARGQAEIPSGARPAPAAPQQPVKISPQEELAEAERRFGWRQQPQPTEIPETAFVKRPPMGTPRGPGPAAEIPLNNFVDRFQAPPGFRGGQEAYDRIYGVKRHGYVGGGNKPRAPIPTFEELGGAARRAMPTLTNRAALGNALVGGSAAALGVGGVGAGLAAGGLSAYNHFNPDPLRDYNSAKMQHEEMLRPMTEEIKRVANPEPTSGWNPFAKPTKPPVDINRLNELNQQLESGDFGASPYSLGGWNPFVQGHNAAHYRKQMETAQQAAVEKFQASGGANAGMIAGLKQQLAKPGLSPNYKAVLQTQIDALENPNNNPRELWRQKMVGAGMPDPRPPQPKPAQPQQPQAQPQSQEDPYNLLGWQAAQGLRSNPHTNPYVPYAGSP